MPTVAHDNKKCKGITFKKDNDHAAADNKFAAQIAEQIQNWQDYLLSSSIIFIHAPGKNRRFFVSDVIDSKSYQIPFTTTKPCFAEIMRAYNKLSTVLYATDFW